MPMGTIDVEDPRPRVVVGEPAAERGAERRREDDAEAVDAHRDALLLGRERLAQDRLRHGHQHAAADALHDAEDHHTMSECASPHAIDAMVNRTTLAM